MTDSVQQFCFSATLLSSLKTTIFFKKMAVRKKKMAAFLKNAETFEAKRPDVFLKRLGVADMHGCCRESATIFN